MMINTTIISLFGGPGCGKSTLGAGVYHKMKVLNYNVELVREYVKAWAWRGDKINKYDELYVFSKQLREESNLYGKVDYIITDRPLSMSAVYDRFYNGPGLVFETARLTREMQINDGLKHLDLIVQRPSNGYSTLGRFHSEDEAVKIDKLTLELFPDLKIVQSVGDVMKLI